MIKSALALQNLQEYITYCMEISSWERHSFDGIEVIFNGQGDSVFNYVFCKEDVRREEVIKVLQFLKEKEWEMTWPVDSHMHSLRNILDGLGIAEASTPKKAFLDVSNFVEISAANKVHNVKLVRVNNDELIDKYDKSTSEIFYHDTGMVTKLLRGIPEDKSDKLQFFLTKLNDEYVGTCALYIGSTSVGFYADGVFSKFRGHGIASKMITEKIKIAQHHGCKYAIAHCMKQSVNLYQRLGFKMLGGLRLYVSSPWETNL